MPPVRIQVGEDGSIVLPLEFRKELGVCEGDTVLMRLVDGELRVYTLEGVTKKLQDWVRSFVPEDRSLVDELIAERRAEAARE